MTDTKIFEGEATISQSAGHIQKILVLEKKEKTLSSWSAYNNAVKNSGEERINRNRLESNILALLLDLWAILERKNKKPEEIQEKVKSGEYYEAIKEIASFLDEIGLTKFDTKFKLDHSNIAQRNKVRMGY